MRSGNESIREEYTAAAADYDRRWGRYVDRSVGATLARAAVATGERVVDIGCGTGALLERLAREQPADRLTGVDLTPAMLAVARGRLPAAVALEAARAEYLPFRDGTFDVAISCNVLHFVPAPERALGEMRRVIRPGGRIVITDWRHDFLACRILQRWQRLTGRPHHRIHRSTELAEALQALGFRDITLERYRIGWWWGMMTVAAVGPD